MTEDLFKKRYIAAALLLSGFTFAAVALAQVQIKTNIPFVSEASNPCDAVFSFYRFALMLSGVLAFGAIVYGGIKYTLAAGNPSGQSEGKEWVKSALLGLLLLVSAYLILNVINPNLTKCTLPELAGIKIEIKPTVPPDVYVSSGCNVATFSGSGFNGMPGSGGSIQFMCVSGANCPDLACNDDCKNYTAANCENGVTVPNGGLTDAVVRAGLTAAGINVVSSGNCSDPSNPSCTALDGMQQITVSTLQSLASQCGSGCSVTVTAGTETGHANGRCSHSAGYKADISSSNSSLNSFITSLPKAGTRGNGVQLYAFNGGTIADERNLSGVSPHWDLSAPC